ncbi:MAG: DMT family transporter [Rhizobiales bacterium]|nr:DMT family transporter [Hyphomicrobiales bacterium]
MTLSKGDAASLVRKGLVITTAGGLFYSFDLPLLRLAASDKWTMVCARGFFLFLSISALWYLLRRHGAGNTPYIAGAAGLAVALTSTITNITFVGAVVETSAANVVFITALIPIFTVFLQRIFLGEKVHPLTWLAAVMSFLGVGMIVWDSVGHGKLLGDILAITSALFTAAAFTIIRASGKNVTASFAIGSLASAVVALAFFDVSPGALLAQSSFGVPAWSWIALNGLIAIPLASTLIANGPRFLPSADVSMFSCWRPFSLPCGSGRCSVRNRHRLCLPAGLS